MCTLARARTCKDMYLQSGAGCRYLRGGGYTDAVCNKTTWHWPLWGGRFVLKGSYDHIFYKHSGPWTLSNASVMTDYVDMSDHLPVVATFHRLSS